jgi:hypothetical protein
MPWKTYQFLLDLLRLLLIVILTAMVISVTQLHAESNDFDTDTVVMSAGFGSGTFNHRPDPVYLANARLKGDTVCYKLDFGKNDTVLYIDSILFLRIKDITPKDRFNVGFIWDFDLYNNLAISNSHFGRNSLGVSPIFKIINRGPISLSIRPSVYHVYRGRKNGLQTGVGMDFTTIAKRPEVRPGLILMYDFLRKHYNGFYDTHKITVNPFFRITDRLHISVRAKYTYRYGYDIIAGLEDWERVTVHNENLEITAGVIIVKRKSAVWE